MWPLLYASKSHYKTPFQKAVPLQENEENPEDEKNGGDEEDENHQDVEAEKKDLELDDLQFAMLKDITVKTFHSGMSCSDT